MKEKTKKTLYVRPEIKMIPMDGFELMAASPSSDDITLNYRDVESIDTYTFDPDNEWGNEDGFGNKLGDGWSVYTS
jgi:hypothetical protein